MPWLRRSRPVTRRPRRTFRSSLRRRRPFRATTTYRRPRRITVARPIRAVTAATLQFPNRQVVRFQDNPVLTGDRYILYRLEPLAQHRASAYFLQSVRVRYMGLGEDFSSRMVIFSSYEDYPERPVDSTITPAYPCAPFEAVSTHFHPQIDRLHAYQMSSVVLPRGRPFERTFSLNKRPPVSYSGLARRVKHYYLALLTATTDVGQIDPETMEDTHNRYSVHISMDMVYRVPQ
jgi:hypothetical protein